MPLASGADAVNVSPAHAVPAAPVALDEIANTPGSGDGQTLVVIVAAQDKAIRISVTMFDSLLFGAVLVLDTVNDPESPLWPTATALGTVIELDMPMLAEATLPVRSSRAMAVTSVTEPVGSRWRMR
jgi:hypothetical protein